MTMIYFQNTTDFHVNGPTAVTLGKFDGVHLGHQKLFDLITSKQKTGLTGVVFTLNPGNKKLILTEDEQTRVIEDLGVDCLIRCPFVPEISGMSPDDFVREVLVGRLHARYIAVGTDFRFGFRRAGDAAFLKSCESKYGFQVCVIQKETCRGREISSTYVREALSGGEMELVRELTGRYFFVQGDVVHGRHLGTSMGMPTANLRVSSQQMLPPDGVYISRTAFGDRRPCLYEGVTNIGVKPTVGSFERGIETYLFTKEPDLYGYTLRTELLHYMRAEQKFQNLEQLVKQIQDDIGQAKNWFERQGRIN